MTPNVVARSVVWLAIIAPWVSLLPFGSGVVAVALAVVTLIASFHGFGLLVSRLVARTDLPAALIVHWGLALMLAIAGLAMSVHAYGAAMQTIVVLTGAGLHSGLLALRSGERSDRLAAFLREADARFYLIPGLMLVLVAMLHVLGTAGDLGARPFDDDGHHLAQIKRLWDTGTLADPVGFARESQLGGQIVAGSFAGVLGDLRMFRVIDGGLGFALLLWLVLAQLKPRTATASIWATLAILVAVSSPSVAVDALPHWLAATMIVALYVTFGEHVVTLDDRMLWPLGLAAGALAILRTELAPISVAIVTGAWILGRRRTRRTPRTAMLVMVPLAVVIPFVVVRCTARAGTDASVFASIVPERTIVIPVVMFVAIIAIGGLLSRRILDPHRRWVAIATLAAIAGIISQVSGVLPYASSLLWPIVVGAGLALGVLALRRRPATAGPHALGLVMALIACALIFDGRNASGRARWVRRYTELVSSIGYLRTSHAHGDPHDVYAALLAHVPASATIAIWVARPETLDYSSHRIIDLRTPRVARLRQFRWEQHRSSLSTLVSTLGADYLLIEDDHLPIERAQRDVVYRFACPDGAVELPCADDLEAIALGHPSVAAARGVRLIKLRPSPAARDLAPVPGGG